MATEITSLIRMQVSVLLTPNGWAGQGLSDVLNSGPGRFTLFLDEDQESIDPNSVCEVSTQDDGVGGRCCGYVYTAANQIELFFFDPAGAAANPLLGFTAVFKTGAAETAQRAVIV